MFVHLHKKCLFYSASLLLIFVAGCRSEISVSGKAAYDGQPIGRGTIVFCEANRGVNYDGMISQGSYKLRAPAGDYLVRVNAVRTENVEKPGEVYPGVPGPSTVEVSYIPSTYNTHTTLKATVSSKERVHNFDMELVENDPYAPPFMRKK
ncbi:MAG: hypothetical protein Q4G68_07380 [Planctomycetia bacterium]|nr:hypothetical protein [Planctomycetia bacterium]